MMAWEAELAKMFKDRENKDDLKIVKGVVKNKSPLIISIFDGQIILNKSRLYVTDTFQNLITSVGSNQLMTNDSVLLGTPDAQMYYVIDRIRKVV